MRVRERRAHHLAAGRDQHQEEGAQRTPRTAAATPLSDRRRSRSDRALRSRTTARTALSWTASPQPYPPRISCARVGIGPGCPPKGGQFRHPAPECDASVMKCLPTGRLNERCAVLAGLPSKHRAGGRGFAITRISTGVVVRGWHMAFFGIGSALSSASPSTSHEAAPLHPSAPIPVQGPPVGGNVRVALGETGLKIFPLILGGAEFGWKRSTSSPVTRSWTPTSSSAGTPSTPPTASRGAAASTSSASG